MTFTGQALLTMWNDFDPEHEVDYNQWHPLEHMPERLSVPGFIAGRRYRLVETAGQANTPGAQRYFGIYQTRDVEVLRSPEYLALLNRPTEWSLKLQPHFQNFVRSGAEPVLSIGEGVVKYVASIRIIAEDHEALQTQLTESLPALTEQTGVTAIHLAKSRADTTNTATAETALRKNDATYAFDLLVMIEGWEVELLKATTADAISLVQSNSAEAKIQSGIYDLVYTQQSNH